MSASVFSREDVEAYLNPAETDSVRAARRDLFYLAFAKLTTDTAAFPVGSLQSFFSIAGIHGEPYVEYDRSGLDPAHPEKGGRQAGYCHHGSVLFPTWHRPYCLLIEKAIQRAAHLVAEELRRSNSQLAAECHQRADELRLPYWSWDAPGLRVYSREKDHEGYQQALPAVFRAPSVAISHYQPNKALANPLLHYTYQQAVGTHAATTDKAVGYTSRLTWSTMQQWWAGNYYRQVSSGLADLMLTPGWQLFSNHSAGGNSDTESLEGIHDALHGYVGGGQYEMSDPSYAAFDPLFFFHHCNVDRMLAIWQHAYPNEWILQQGSPVPPGIGTFVLKAGDLVNGSTPLAPFRQHIKTDGALQQPAVDSTGWQAGQAFFTSDDCKSVQQLGYTYRGLDDPKQPLFAAPLVQLNTTTIANGSFDHRMNTLAPATAVAAATGHSTPPVRPPIDDHLAAKQPDHVDGDATHGSAGDKSAENNILSSFFERLDDKLQSLQDSLGKKLHLTAPPLSPSHPQPQPPVVAAAAAAPAPAPVPMSAPQPVAAQSASHVAMASTRTTMTATEPSSANSRISSSSSPGSAAHSTTASAVAVTELPPLAVSVSSQHAPRSTFHGVDNRVISPQGGAYDNGGVQVGGLSTDGITISQPASTNTYTSTSYATAPTQYNGSSTQQYQQPAHLPALHTPAAFNTIAPSGMASGGSVDARAWIVTFKHLPKMYFGGPYFVRVFINKSDADESTPLDCDEFAGQVFVFARGNQVSCPNCEQHSKIRLSLNITHALVRLGLVNAATHELSGEVHVKALLVGNHVQELRRDADKDAQLNNDAGMFDFIVRQMSSPAAAGESLSSAAAGTAAASTASLHSHQPVAHHVERRFELQRHGRQAVHSPLSLVTAAGSADAHPASPASPTSAGGPFHFIVAAQRHPSRMHVAANLQPTQSTAAMTAAAAAH